ncbi:hypothetical protein [Vibrio diazotrophicus]|uniref:hypothetical protein n=1 Tax=Vibrio diazotrophicus TaxID=685 RepID=UPI000C9DEEF1|nr:hypothetical protein [Vibrio diazotrophicus]PNH82456.1 hypothetical protein C1N27_03025 [Vibrio diazotrophicus]
MSNVIYSSEENRIAIEYFSRLTNTVGAVGFGVVFGLFSLPPFYAWFAFGVFFVWSFFQGYQYRAMLNRTMENARPSVWIFIKHGWLCLLSLTLMASVALGFISKDAFLGFVL